MTKTNQDSPLISRRSALGRCANGLGAITLTSMLQDQLVADDQGAPGAPAGINAHLGHHKARAKRVIFLWMSGGPSQMDTFDPKPKINELAAKKENVTEAPFKFKQHGQSGMWVSELLPHIAQQADDLCVIRSMKGETNTHEHAQTFIMTGVPQNNTPVPTIGSWVVYGLGSESRNLPALISIGQIHPKISESFFPSPMALPTIRFRPNSEKQVVIKSPIPESPIKVFGLAPILTPKWLISKIQRERSAAFVLEP